MAYRFETLMMYRTPSTNTGLLRICVSSSWLKAPAEIRKLGGALYCDRRYGRVFVGHNGAQSYYAGRGFRGLLRV